MEASIGRVGQRTPGGRTIHRAAIVALARAGHVDPCSYQLILEGFPLSDGDVWKSSDRDQRNCAKAKYTTPVHEDASHMPMSIKATLRGNRIVRNGSASTKLTFSNNASAFRRIATKPPAR